MRRWRMWGLVAVMVLSLGRVSVAQTGPDAAAEAADRSWLQLVDAGRYGESWSAAAAYLRSAISAEAFAKALAGVREPLGAVKSRTLGSATRATTLPGAPDGEYVVCVFDTSFADKEHARETVTAMREKDGSWRVSGYYIR